MPFIDMFLIGVGLSMDAFAVSVCKGLCFRKIDWPRATLTAFFFGLFQAGMPLLGWLLGTSVQSFIKPVDHWVAFILLSIIGGKMIWDAFHEDDDECKVEKDSFGKFFIELLVLSVATSIDAFVAGISFAMSGIDIWVAIVVIGITTFVLSLVGFVVGNKFGSKFERWATLAGGIALILLGLKIVLEHLGFL